MLRSPRYFIICLALAAVCPALAGGKLDGAAKSISTDGQVNLARLGIASASVSSVNGDRESNNGFYGVQNMFDDGVNMINNINYTYWLSGTSSQQWVKVDFAVPVTLDSLMIELTDTYQPKEFAVEVTTSAAGKQSTEYFDSEPVKGFVSTYRFPRRITNVRGLKVKFPTFGMVAVSEIRAFGTAPAGTDLAPKKPSANPVQEKPSQPANYDPYQPKLGSD